MSSGTKLVGACLAPERIAYFAGLFDGEGSFRIQRGGGAPSRMCKTVEASLTLGVQVVNTHKPVLELLRAAYGGGIYENTASTKRGWNTSWSWILSGKGAARFANDIAPHLTIKREQAEACLLFAETYHKPWREFHHNGLTPEAVKLRNIAFKAFRAATERRTGRGLSWKLA